LPVVVLVLVWRVPWVRAVVVVVVREVAVVLSSQLAHGNSWTVKRPYLRSLLQPQHLVVGKLAAALLAKAAQQLVLDLVAVAVAVLVVT
jgi:hypothetical protein